MSRNNYLGKEFNTNAKHLERNKKYGKDIEILNINGLNQINENNKFNTTDKSKVKLTDKKNDGNERNMKISDEENLQYRKQSSKKKENEINNGENGENIKNGENNKIYINKIKELEETITKMNSNFSKEIQTHKNEILEKDKSIKKLINSNNNLKKSLELLTQRLDKILINADQQKPKLNKILNDKSQEDLKHQLEIKEKELKNQQQLIKILTKDNKNIRKILNDFGISHENNNNINMADKIHEQYQEIQKLQKDIKELKEKNNSLSQPKKDGKSLNLNTDSSNKFSSKFFLNKKIALNSIQRPGNNIHKFNTNKSQSDLKVKKKVFSGLNPVDQMNDPESIFSIEEIDILKSSFYDERRYEQFLNKISILQKATISKEKEMNMKVKLFENQLKQKEKEIKTLNDQSKEKDNKIIELNVQNKELKKIQDDLVMKIKYLASEFNQLEEKNQMILKKNEQIKNSIFSIDGIIEATSKEGEPIPLLVEVRKDSITIEKSNASKEEVKDSENK